MWIVSIAHLLRGIDVGRCELHCDLLDKRAPGLRMMQMPLTCWNWFVTAILSLLGFPVLFAAECFRCLIGAPERTFSCLEGFL